MPVVTATRPATLSDMELVLSLRAAKPWSKARDIPDIVGLADFAYAPEQALPALRSRLGVFPAHRSATQFPLAKPSGKHRALLYADPIDEAVYRAAVGRIAPRVDGALGPEVQSYRLRRARPTWELRHYHYGDAERRSEAQSFVASSSFGALAQVDVERYYPSIKRDVLGQVLLETARCLAPEVECILALLEDWNENWTVSGVPAGPEASGILGNAMLMRLDEVLRARGVGFSRFTDDVILLLPKGCDWEQLNQAIVEVLEPLGLTLNNDKTLYTEAPSMPGWWRGWTVSSTEP